MFDMHNSNSMAASHKFLITLIIGLLFLPSCLKNSTNDHFGPLPVPSIRFMEQRDTMLEVTLNYLNKYYSPMDRKILQTYPDCDSCICDWEREYEEGIKYRYYDCDEVGYQVRIDFMLEDITKSDVFQFVNHLFEDPNNRWNADSTTYEPADGGKGAYYTIVQQEDRILLKYFQSLR